MTLTSDGRLLRLMVGSRCSRAAWKYAAWGTWAMKSRYASAQLVWTEVDEGSNGGGIVSCWLLETNKQNSVQTRPDIQNLRRVNFRNTQSIREWPSVRQSLLRYTRPRA